MMLWRRFNWRLSNIIILYMNHSQLVSVWIRNRGSSFVYRVVSDKPITMEGVVKYFVDDRDFDFDKDTDKLMFIDEVTGINLVGWVYLQ